MARLLTIIEESWNHPLVQRLEKGSTLHGEITRTLLKIPETE